MMIVHQIFTNEKHAYCIISVFSGSWKWESFKKEEHHLSWLLLYINPISKFLNLTILLVCFSLCPCFVSSIVMFVFWMDMF